MKKYILVFALALTGLIAAAQTYKYPPRNEVNKDSSLKVFADTLKAVVNRKDAPALLKLLSADVQVVFEDVERKEDSHNNIKGFKEIYAPQYPSSQVWKNLHTVISMGGVFGEDRCADCGHAGKEVGPCSKESRTQDGRDFPQSPCSFICCA